MTSCKGDAKYGPLLFLEGERSRVDLEVIPDESDFIVHALATIHGKDHQVTLKPVRGKNRTKPTPILIGHTAPPAGEGMAHFSEKRSQSISILNKTNNPVVLSDKAKEITVR